MDAILGLQERSLLLVVSLEQFDIVAYAAHHLSHKLCATFRTGR
jgi:hypothetical protein